MGASQSNKSQLGGQRPGPIGDHLAGQPPATGGYGQPQQPARHKLGASLRKSVSSVLGKSQKQLGGSSPIKRKEIPAPIGSEHEPRNGNGASQLQNGGNQLDSSYYVSNNNNNFTTTASSMNNYVTMQQQQQQQAARPMMVSSLASQKISAAAAAGGGGGSSSEATAKPATQLDQGKSNGFGLMDGGAGNNGRPNGVYGSYASGHGGGSARSKAGTGGNNFYTIEPMDDNIMPAAPTKSSPSSSSSSSSPLAPTTTNRDGSLNGAQDTQQAAANIGTKLTASRSQHQPHHHTTSTSPPFHLSRAINTKTSSALNAGGPPSLLNHPNTTTNNNSATTPTITTNTNTNTKAVAMPKGHGRMGPSQRQASTGQQSPASVSKPPRGLQAANQTVVITSSSSPLISQQANNRSPPSQHNHHRQYHQAPSSYQPNQHQHQHHHHHHQISSSNKSSLSSSSPPVAYQQQQHQQRPTNAGPQQYLTSYSSYERSVDNSDNLAEATASAENYHHPPQQRQQFYARNLLDMDNQLNGSLQQQHQQVRYKCPQQQYQYLNSNPNPTNLYPSAIDFHQATYNNNNNTILHPAPSYSKPLFITSNPLKQQPPLDCHQSANNGYNRSYSFGSSSRGLLLEPSSTGGRSLKKSLNPLMSIFQGSSPQTNNITTTSKHSNTISLAKHRSNNHNKSSSNINQSVNHRSFSGSLKRIKSTPLTAQQASYEAMRTIDMYMIRQIARSCMDFEMEQKIDLEIRLRELAAQSMLEARTEIDVLEVEKSLLTSDQRMNCYASQLEQQRKQLSNPSLSTDSGRGSKSERHRRSDVVGAASSAGSAGGGSGNGDTSSPSFSSLSNSQSPSKLSPVSGQSANSPSFNGDSHYSNSNKVSGAGGGAGYGHTRRCSSSSTNTLRRRAKNKKRDQLMQSITSLSNINCNMAINNRASVCVSEIRIPLMWRDVDHFKGRGDYKRFAVFCLLKIDSQIYDTQLISDVDRQVTDVTFDDMVLFNEIDHTFELTLEVYSCVYLEQFSFSSTPRKLKEKLTSSVSRAMGRRLATQTASVNYTKELQAYDKSYRFAMIASATLRLDDASDSVKTYDLVLVSPSAHHRNPYPIYGTNNDYHHHLHHSSNTTAHSMTLSNSKETNKNTLPLFGHFCCKLLVRPDVFDKGIKTGYLKVATINVPMNHHSNSSNNNNNSSDSNQTLASSNGSVSDHSSHLPISTNGYDSNYNIESTTKSTTTTTLRLAASSKMATLSMSSSTVHWGLLRNFALHLWPIDEQRLDYSAIIRGELPQFNDPHGPPITLNIDKYTRLLRVSNSSLTLETGDCCIVLGTYCPDAGLINQADEISHWLRAIEQQIYDSHIWGSVLNHYPPHAKQPTGDTVAGGRSSIGTAQTPMRNFNGRNIRMTATTYS